MFVKRLLKNPCSVAPPCLRSRPGDAGSSPNGCSGFTGAYPLQQRRISTDSSGQLSSSPLSSSAGHRGITNHPLHPPLLSPSAMSSSPGQLHSPISTLSSPINGLPSPFPVISSPMGHPSMSGPSSTGMTFRPSLSPQVCLSSLSQVRLSVITVFVTSVLGN
ncbi:retinoic acid receptor RXR-alpha-B isoform X1 [Labeo rohita]|uniref:Retinoic acid receptor RXR-alpha-B isoform X1 n=1 Tax=Labeo rohita TaxID=84645 RepID=A0A498MMF1_LABRO|nr:retinoic acid receptor RXR-alpha-B isoform X1 [Labeo rohita]